MRIMKNRIIIFSTLYFITCMIQLVRAQENLTLQQALEIGLENNFSIRIARGEEDIARYNASLGNAGFLPQINATASVSRSVNDSKQKFLSGSVLDREGAESTSRTAGVALNWTLFDGLNMFISYQRLKEFQDLGELTTRQSIETTVSEIIEAYYDVVQHQQKLQSLEEQVNLSNQRLRITEANYNLGSGSKLDILNARVDLNADQAALMQQKYVLDNACTSLNQLMARPAELTYAIRDSIPLNRDLALQFLQEAMLSKNTGLLMMRNGFDIAKLELRSAWSQQLPRIGLNLGYNISVSESQAGFSLYSRNEGYVYGLSASLNLFEGLSGLRKIQNAKITRRSAELQLADLKNQLDASLLKLYQRYQTNLKLVDMEVENLSVAKENVRVTLERYRIGSISALELRDVQSKYAAASSRLISAKFQAKSSETELLAIGGLLLDEMLTTAK